MEHYKPLVELTEDVETIQESDDDKKSLYLRGVIIKTDMLNGNNRIYPESVWVEALEQYKPMLDDSRALGELDHPTAPDKAGSVNPEKVSHLFTEIEKTYTGEWIAKLKVLNTPSGRIVRAIVEGGGKIGLSLRGLGKTVNRGGYRIVESLRLITLGDLVLNPSVGEYQTPLYENQEYVFENEIFKPVKKFPISKLLEYNFNKPIVEREPLPVFKNWNEIYQEQLLNGN